MANNLRAFATPSAALSPRYGAYFYCPLGNSSSRGCYPIPRSFWWLTSRKALKNARSVGSVPIRFASPKEKADLPSVKAR